MRTLAAASLLLCCTVFVSAAPTEAGMRMPTLLAFDEGVTAEDPHAGEDGVEEDGVEEGDHEAHPEGPPMSPKADLALWSLIVFAVLLFVLGKFAWGPLVEGLDKRESGIRKDIASAEAARAEAERLLEEHRQQVAGTQDEVSRMLADARRQAEEMKQQIVSDAKEEAEAARQRAQAEIEQASQQAQQELRGQLADWVVEATQKVLSRTLSEEDDRRLVDEAVSQVGPQQS